MKKMIALCLLCVPLWLFSFENYTIRDTYTYYDMLRIYLDEQRAPTMDQNMMSYREKLEKEAFSEESSLNTKRIKQRNFAALVLGLYQVAGVGGPEYDEDGIRNIVTVLNHYFYNQETLPSCIKDTFPTVVRNCFRQAADNGSNYYQALYALAFLYQGPTGIRNPERALHHLQTIIQAPHERRPWDTPVDIALRNRARVLKAKILLQDNQPPYSQEIRDLLYTVLSSSHDDDGEFIGNCYPEDAMQAKLMVRLHFPPLQS